MNQGGRSVRDNLVYACHRCNAQKGHKTPAQWKRWRDDRDLAWPPADCFAALTDLCLGFDDESAELMRPAFRAFYPPLMNALRQFSDEVYDETDPPFTEWRAIFRAAAEQYAIAIDV